MQYLVPHVSIATRSLQLEDPSRRPNTTSFIPSWKIKPGQFYNEGFPPCPPCGAVRPGAPASPACSIYPQVSTMHSPVYLLPKIVSPTTQPTLTELAPSLISPSSLSLSIISCSWPKASAYGIPISSTLVDNTQRPLPV